MNGTLSKVLIFTAGAAIGSLVTWKLCKTKYETLVQEEIDSVKETFSVRKIEEPTSENTQEEDDIMADENREEPQQVRRVSNKPDLQEYAQLIEKYRNEIPSDEIDELEENFNGIYPIKPESFGDDDYNTEYYTLYADDVIADGQDFVVEDVKGKIGSHFKEYFGVYEQDLVCIRNDELKTDYEICRDDRNYSDLYSTNTTKGDTE